MPSKRGKSWEAQVVFRKKKYRKSGLQTKYEALKWELNKKEELENNQNLVDTACDVVSIWDWANKYLDFAKVKFTSKTYKEKVAVFSRLFEQVDKNMNVNFLTNGHILDYCLAQHKKRSANAVNADRKNLVAAWHWGVRYMSLTMPNPCNVDKLPEQRHPRYIPPERDFWAVYDVAGGQEKVLLLSCLHLAARRGEILALRWEDVNFAEGKVRLFTRKRKDGSLESDWLPMTDELLEALLDHRQKANTEWVFPNPETALPYIDPRKILKRLCKKAGVKPFGFHAIRHLTASILAKHDVPLVDIQAILRHQRLSTTEKYIRQLRSVRPALRLLSRKKKPTISPHRNPQKKKGLQLIQL